jgi:hypothetical protein
MAKTNIESLDNRPWVPHAIPNEIRKEFYRRKLDRGINYVSGTDSWYDNVNTWTQYKGPMSSWVRVTSNGTGITKNVAQQNKLSQDEIERQKRDGFILYGGQGFDSSYGVLDFKKQASDIYTPNTIGYDVNGNPHTLNLTSNSQYTVTVRNEKTVPILIPPPGIVSVETSIQKERIRKATINWKCYSFAQLEYLTPYFLTPGISLIVEVGWNHFNLSSLLDLTDTQELTSLFIDGSPLYTRMLNSNGMYDVTFGIIANFEFSSQDGVTYDCRTEVYSKHRNHTGAFLNAAPKTTKVNDEVLTRPSFSEFCSQRLNKVSKCLSDKKNFFEALDPSEEEKQKKGSFNNTELIKQFYKGNPEDRICLARKKIDSDPFNKYSPEEHDWDRETPDDTWVTMEFVIELYNLFVTQEITLKEGQRVNNQEETFKLFTIDIGDTIIGGHRNLISTNGNILLIPNAQAPKFNLGAYYWVGDYEGDVGNNKFQSQTYSLQTGSSASSKTLTDPKKTSLDDIILFKTFKTGYNKSKTSKEPVDTGYINRLKYTFGQGPLAQVENTQNEPISNGIFRDNLDQYVNRFRYNNVNGNGEYSFPQYKDNSKGYKSGKWGYLKDLYININTVINASKDSTTSEEFLNRLLKDITGAVGGFWDFSVIEDDKKLRVIDKKLISTKLFENVFQFDIDSDSFIKSISFSGTPTAAQANQVIAGSSNNKNSSTGLATANELPDFYFGDRLGANQLKPDVVKSVLNESSDVIKQLQKYGKKSDAFLISLRSGGANRANPNTKQFYQVYNLVLPSVPLLLTILNDDDFENNLNIYGGQQPNFTCEITLQGISGLRTFQCFSIKNLPKPYSETEIIFQIVDISHSIQNGDWVTTIKAGIRPIRGRNIIFSDGKEEFYGR